MVMLGMEVTKIDKLTKHQPRLYSKATVTK